MTYQFTVSPDFSPRHAPSWYVFNTWLQRALDGPFHLELYDSFDGQRAAIAADRVDLIFANPYDASMLIRGHGFVAVAAPTGSSDEALVVVPAPAKAQRVQDLSPGTRVSATDDPDVNLMGLLLLEPADLGPSNLVMARRDSYIAVAKDLLRGEADAGFFLEATFEELSAMVRADLRVIARSRIHLVRHVLLAGPQLVEQRQVLTAALLRMTDEARGAELLHNLGFSGWQALEPEDVEFMIDLIDTLVAPAQ